MKNLCLLTLFAGALSVSSLPHLHAQTVVTSVPEGFVSVNIVGSPNGTAYAVTQLSVPLDVSPAITGANVGKITAVAAGSLTNSTAGWTASALANAASPCFVRINSGTAAGRMLRITANTATVLTVDTQGQDLTTLGIVANTDTYQIVSGETLLNLLGTPAEGVIGGTAAQLAANQVDKVLATDASGTLQFFYYDTSASQWRRDGSATNENNLVIAPYAGLAYYRISATPLKLVFLGTVPPTPARMLVPRSGTGIYATYFPVSTTLSALGLNSLPGWRKLGDAGVTLDTVDRVIALDGAGVLRSYYHNGANWLRPGSTTNQNATAIKEGTAIYVGRNGAGANETWTRALPYTLN